MKVFLSYHRADEKYRNKIEEMLKKNKIQYYAVSQNVNFDGKNHQHIKDIINKHMEDCDVVICIVGRDTYSRPHVDWELHEALKGDYHYRKGIVAVMLETRDDRKNNIDFATFPNRLQENIGYIVIEQFCSFGQRIVCALNEATDRSRDRHFQTRNKHYLMELKKGLYFDES